MAGLALFGAEQGQLPINRDGNREKQDERLLGKMAGAPAVQQVEKAETKLGLEPERGMEVAIDPAFGQTSNAKPEMKSKFFAGINVAHSIVVSSISALIGDEVFYLPVHFDFHFALSNTFGLSGLLLYRYEKDGYYFKTNEFGFAVGPRLSLSKKGIEGFYVTCQVGAGFCFGKEYSGSDYYRIDFIINPEFGYVIPTKGRLGFAVGIGLQTLVPIVEDYEGYYWSWKDIGNLSHYYLPVIKLSIGIK
jgi:hypothetical protein